MTLGPGRKIGAELYPELVGLASHELFHVWNVIRIRPAELLPYDFSRENYFPTGYVAEGLTTYYGDLLLARSGFFSPTEYLAELNGTLNRHFTSSNGAALSLTESSLDLWLDGYVAGVPGRKVSIYHKGTLTALILDLEFASLPTTPGRWMTSCSASGSSTGKRTWVIPTPIMWRWWKKWPAADG
jgi:predicted metalloprotease with PDZ domain